jgi:hypothetical protein
MRSIHLKMGGTQAQAFQTASRRAAQSVAADAARDKALVTEESSHVREVGRRST